MANTNCLKGEYEKIKLRCIKKYITKFINFFVFTCALK